MATPGVSAEIGVVNATGAPHTSSPGEADPFSERVRAVEARLEALDGLEPVARTVAHAAVQGVVGVYGEALARIVAGLRRWGEDAAGGNGQLTTANAAAGERPSSHDPLELLLEDDLIAHLLILHELHPLDLLARVECALEEVRPQLQSQGNDVGVESIEDGVLRLRVSGMRQPSARSLHEAVMPSLRRLAPEIERIEVVPAPALVQLGVRRS